MPEVPATSPAKALERKYGPIIIGFQERANQLQAAYNELMKRPEPWGAMTEARFEQCAQAAKLLDDKALTEERQIVAEGKKITQPLDQAHKAAVAHVNRLLAGPKAARAICGKVITAFDAYDKRKREEIRRADEARRLAAAKAEREREVAHLQLMAESTGDDSFAEESEQLQAEPIRVAPAQAPEQTKIEGASTSTKKELVVDDWYAFICWMVASRDRFEAMWPGRERFTESELNGMAKRGLTPDGTHVNEVQTYANRKRSDQLA